MKKMKIGNKNHISFKLSENNSSDQLSNLSFYLGGKLISNELIYIPTYISLLEIFVDDIENERLKNIKFEDLTSKQVFKTLFEEKDSNEPQFFKHLLRIDETIDQYNIFVFQTNETTRFVWACLDYLMSFHLYFLLFMFIK